MSIYSEIKKELRDIVKQLEIKNLFRLLSCAKGLLKGQQEAEKKRNKR
jgi:hypothetical protein